MIRPWDAHSVRMFTGLPRAVALACRRLDVLPGRRVLVVSVLEQAMEVWDRRPDHPDAADRHGYQLAKRLLISTSRFGIGQREGSNRTPLGLHRIARKVGEGWPPGAVWKHRRLQGWTWQGLPGAPIAHRILWLEGLEPGLNHGPGIDSFRRYIYIHGIGNERTLGRPASHGCIHLAAKELIPLADRTPIGTLVWIAAGPSVSALPGMPLAAENRRRHFGLGLL